jgi:hypothetical protein
MNRKVDQQQPLTTTRAVKLLSLSLTRQIPITTSQQAETHRTSIMINLIASMFLRIGGRACTILLSLYLKDTITSTAIVAVLSQIGYISELGLAPFAGNLSDRVGHKPLLILAPVLGFFSTLCILLGLLLVPSPPGDRINPATLILSGCIIGSRLLDGTMTAVHGPVSMSHFMIATTGQDRLRNRVMTLFEVFTLGGIAIALFGGGTASNLLGTQAYYIQGRSNHQTPGETTAPPFLDLSPHSQRSPHPDISPFMDSDQHVDQRVALSHYDHPDLSPYARRCAPSPPVALWWL